MKKAEEKKDVVIIVSTGKCSFLPKGAEYEVTEEIAKELLRKKFATVK